MFDPDAHLPRLNKGMIYIGACMIAGMRSHEFSPALQATTLRWCKLTAVPRDSASVRLERLQDSEPFLQAERFSS